MKICDYLPNEILYKSNESSEYIYKDGQEFHYIKGQRNSTVLVYANYHYVKYLENSRGVKWICARRSSTKCRARIRIKKTGQVEILCAEHNHNYPGYRGINHTKFERLKSQKQL